MRRPLCTSVVRFHVGMGMDVERISAVRVVDPSPWRQPRQSCRCCLFSLHIYHGCYSATTLQEAYARAIGMLNLRKQLINEFSSGNSRWMLAQVLKLFAPLLCDSVLLLRSQRLRRCSGPASFRDAKLRGPSRGLAAPGERGNSVFRGHSLARP